MQEAELLSLLRSVTADLGPGDAGTDALHDLRRRLAASLRDVAQQPSPEPAFHATDVLLETQLRLAVAEAREQTPDAASKSTLVRRETPIVSPLLSAQTAPGEFAGQTPSRTFGPFADALGRKVWFDEFLVRTSVQISWAGRPGVALVLPSAHFLPGATHLEFGAGSVWVAARSLAASTRV